MVQLKRQEQTTSRAPKDAGIKAKVFNITVIDVYWNVFIDGWCIIEKEIGREIIWVRYKQGF